MVQTKNVVKYELCQVRRPEIVDIFERFSRATHPTATVVKYELSQVRRPEIVDIFERFSRATHPTAK